MSSEPLISLNNYKLMDARRNVLLQASIDIYEPGVVAIVGPATGGKSLLLSAVADLLPRGVIAQGTRRVRFPGQERGPDSQRTLEPPIGRGPHAPRGTLFRALAQTIPDEAQPERRIEEALSSISVWEHVQEKLMQPVRSLTPGEQLIVAVCRRLLLKDPVLLMDDPTRGLSIDDIDLLVGTMLEVSRQIPVLWASRSLRSISPVATRIVAIANGKIIVDGPSDRIVVNPGPSGEGVLEETTGHTVSSGLEELYHELLTVGSLAERAVHQGVQSLTDQNLSVAREVQGNNEEIKRRERLIVDRAMGLLGRTGPVGRDLRTLITVIKAVTDLERIADHAVNISEVTLAIGDEPLIKPLIDIPRMAEKAQVMVRYSLDAMVRRDEALAREVFDHHGPVKALYRELFEELLGFITDGGDAYRAGQALYLLFVARYLERVADHAANIAEHVTFMVSGERAHRDADPDDDTLPHPFLPR